MNPLSGSIKKLGYVRYGAIFWVKWASGKVIQRIRDVMKKYNLPEAFLSTEGLLQLHFIDPLIMIGGLKNKAINN